MVDALGSSKYFATTQGDNTVLSYVILSDIDKILANKNGFSREKLSRWHCLQPTFRARVECKARMGRESEWRKRVRASSAVLRAF